MRVLTAITRALPFTFAIYLVEVVLALLAAGPLAVELADDGRPSLQSAIGRVMWLEQLFDLAPALRVQGRVAAVALILLALLAPCLQMGWLRALSQPTSLTQALREGITLYGRAWLVTLATLLFVALFATPFVVIVSAVEPLVADSADGRLHDLTLGLIALPLLPIAWWGFVLHELARARCLRETAWASVVGSLRNALRLRVHLQAALFLGTALLLRAVLLWLAQAGPGVVASSEWLPQSLCALALVLRSGWLACALIAGEPRSAPVS